MKERHTELEAQHQLFFSHSLIIRYATLLTPWFHTDMLMTKRRVTGVKPGFFLGGGGGGAGCVPQRNSIADW